MSLSGKLCRLLSSVLGGRDAANELISAVNAGGGSFGAAITAIDTLTPAANKIPMFSGATTATLKTFTIDGTLAGNSDSNIPSEKAVKAYVDAQAGGTVTNITGNAGTATALQTPRTINGVSFDGTANINIGVPQNSKSADYTLALTDNGKHIFHPSSDANDRTITIPANGTVAFPIGAAVTFVNKSANDLTIAIDTDTLTWADDGSTGSRSLATNGVANAIKVSATEWLITGVNLS